MPSDDRAAMTSAERNAWVAAVLTPATSIAYVVVVLNRLRDQGADEVAWVAPMLWAVGANIALTIVGTIVVAIGSGIANRGELEHSKDDVRDKQINRYGDRIAMAFLGFGAGVVLILTMFEVAYVWIGSALFVLGAIGATWGAVAKIWAYRGGFHG